jgi:hypothetical protein
MSKVMFVTMGTSLFHSASWDPAVEPAHSIPYYDEWTHDEAQASPEKRHEALHSQKIKVALRAALRNDNTKEWAAALPRDLQDEKEVLTSERLRFSAELATLLKLADAEAGHETHRDFLRGYDQIILVHDSDVIKGRINRPWIAALHLECYLTTFLGEGRVALLEVPGISSLEQDRLLGAYSGLGELAGILGACPADQIDLVISGGFKIYGIVLSPAVREAHFGVRLIYLHEEGSSILSYPRRLPQQRQGRRRDDFAAFVRECLEEMRDADL